MNRTHMNHDDACEIATRSHEIHIARRSEFGLTHSNIHFIVIQMHHKTSETVQVSLDST